jgi:hypothetical protein
LSTGYRQVMRTASLRINVSLAVLASTCIAAVQPASALEAGVHVDPGSPAAKEYALPLTQARGTGSTSSPQTNPEGTLFGAGIGPPGSGGPPHAGNPSGHGQRTPGAAGSSSGAGSSAPRGGSGSGPPVTQAVLRAARDQGAGGSGSTLALLGGAVAVLVLGGFGGTVLRHSRRPTSST